MSGRVGGTERLPAWDRTLLRGMELVVPRGARADWRRGWEAELWYGQQARGTGAGLSGGLVCDALWLRAESWRRVMEGTAWACLLALLAMVLVAAVPEVVVAGGARAFAREMVAAAGRFVGTSALILLVSAATADGLAAEMAESRRWWRARLFLAAKTALLLVFAFLMSTDVCRPVGAVSALAELVLQSLGFVVLALFGLRWSAMDGAERCRHCLRLLETPLRVGRPTYNFLEWNGTELPCRAGHGWWAVPEIATSWGRASAWVVGRER